MKRIFYRLWIVLLVLCGTVFVNVAKAQTIVASGSSGTLTWELKSDSVLTINGSGAISNSPWSSYALAIKHVVIGDNVTGFNSSFSNAFSGCSNLTTLKIGRSFEFSMNNSYLYDYIFSGCTSWKEIIVSPNNQNCSSEDGMLYTKSQDALIACPRGKTGIANVSYNTITIRDYAFYHCDKLTSIFIPDGVSYIGGFAFAYCNGLTSINIPSTMINIASGAFNNAHNLTSINVNTTNTTYSSINGVLYNKNHNILIRCPESRTGDFIIPNFVLTISENAFYRCDSLTSIQIPSFVNFIGSYAFCNCRNLTSMTLPPNISVISSSIFDNCIKLKSVNIPERVTYIGDYAFYACISLKSITIPYYVTSISYGAFAYCSGLEQIICKAINPPSLNYYSFSGVSLNTPVYVPCGSVSEYKAASYWSNFTNYKDIGVTTDYRVSVCPATNYSDNNFSTPITEVGTYYHLFENANECDSLVVLHLSYYKIDTTTYDTTICRGASYIDDNFLTPINDTGRVHYVTLLSSHGCDSVVGLRLHNYPQAITPTNLNVSQIGREALRLRWNGSSHTYKLYKDGLLIATLDTNVYRDDDIADGTSYCYFVKGLNECDVEGEKSNEACLMFNNLEEITADSFNIYPNPATDKLFIEGGSAVDYELWITDILGRKMMRDVCNISLQPNGIKEIDISNLPNGIYNVIILSAGQSIGIKKIVKQ